ncbi:hypothetical protein AAFF_G00315810 [Aldrovandia affinis]|uniref:ERAP1-like C-terminal domain-containing protein n=1 Tax=Aldrovandia affinis TaxID=143900 RepID=A0AAD7SN21_9TELE|nr:hypothetical protein AAFF_G00315810 [Aldrovandia affinis]
MEKNNISDTAQNLKNYILRYFRDVIDKQTWSDMGSVSEKTLRMALLELSCDLGYPPCVNRASQLFSEWVASNRTNSYKNTILYALTCSKDAEKLAKLIALGMEGEVIRTQDLPALIVAIARNPVGKALTWNFIRKNWKKLLEKFELGSTAITRILMGTTGDFSSKRELEEVRFVHYLP